MILRSVRRDVDAMRRPGFQVAGVSPVSTSCFEPAQILVDLGRAVAADSLASAAPALPPGGLLQPHADVRAPAPLVEVRPGAPTSEPSIDFQPMTWLLLVDDLGVPLPTIIPAGPSRASASGP
jgi:hypothetical protein